MLAPIFPKIGGSEIGGHHPLVKPWSVMVFEDNTSRQSSPFGWRNGIKRDGFFMPKFFPTPTRARLVCRNNADVRFAKASHSSSPAAAESRRLVPGAEIKRYSFHVEHSAESLGHWSSAGQASIKGVMRGRTMTLAGGGWPWRGTWGK